MSNQDSIAKQYDNAVAQQQQASTAVPSGRWIVQKWDEPRGVYRDQVVTDNAVLAEHGFRQSKEHRIIDSKLNDVAADYSRSSYGAERGEAEYSMRSQFKMTLSQEQERASAAKPPQASQDHLAASQAFLKASSAQERHTASAVHPQLKQAFAAEAGYSKLAQRIEGQSGQNAFVARMRENIATDLAKGRPTPDVKLRESAPSREPRTPNSDRNR